MVFSSIVFLYLFFPIVLVLYCILPQKFRNVLLLISSLIFYAWGEPKYIFIMLFSTIFDYTNGRLLERFDAKEWARKLVLIGSVVINIGILVYFKYTDFAIENINALAHTSFGLLNLTLPVGISFYTFQTLSYTIDVYRRKAEVQHNILNFGMYVCLFPQLIAGPIVRYTDISAQIADRPLKIDYIWQGLKRFTIGLGKKVLIANQIGVLWDNVSAYEGKLPAVMAWTGAIAYAFQIYFDFSGYSDMAIGLGKMFGFDFPENFRYPYESNSITDFWRRWHITLSSWFKEYVYIPLGGNRKGMSRQILNLLIVWSLTGLWHGASWNFVLWGLFWFVLLVAEKLFLLKFLEKLPKFVGHIYALICILIGWVIFACDDFSVLWNYLGSLFGKNGFVSDMSLYYCVTFGLLAVIAGIGVTHAPKLLVQKIGTALGKRKVLWTGMEMIFIVLIFVGSTAFLVGDSYNPFLYFRF